MEDYTAICSMTRLIVALVGSCSLVVGQLMGDGMYPAFGDPASPFNGALARSGMAPGNLGDAARLPSSMANYPAMYPSSSLGLRGRSNVNDGMMMNNPYAFPGAQNMNRGGMMGSAMPMMRSGMPDDMTNAGGSFHAPFRYTSSPFDNQERTRYGGDMFGGDMMSGRMMGGGDPMGGGMGGMGGRMMGGGDPMGGGMGNGMGGRMMGGGDPMGGGMGNGMGGRMMGGGDPMGGGMGNGMGGRMMGGGDPMGGGMGNGMGGRMMGGGDPMGGGMGGSMVGGMGGDMGGMGGMGGMSGGMGGMSGGMGGGMGFMGRTGGMDGDGEGDGMADMFRMQAEMRQMQQQLRHAPAVDPRDKANTTGKVEKLGDNILVTNQTRFVDNNDGMTQGFFQEFRIFPGMETTTAKSEQDERGRMDSGAKSASSSEPAGVKAAQGKLVNPTALFGFAPPDYIFNPRKVDSLVSTKGLSANYFDPAKLPLPLLSGPSASITPQQATNHVALTRQPPVKKAFSAEKFDAISDSFNRAFETL